jgi:hypothetical protein
MPRREVGGLEIFILFLLGQDVLPTDDGLSVSSNSVVAAKMLEPCVSVGHGAPNVSGFPVARTRDTTQRTQRIRTQGLYA